MGRVLLVMALVIGVTMNSISQVKSTVTFLNDDNSELHAIMERNISSLLSEFNAAFSEKRNLNLMNLGMTSEAMARISALWQTSNFRCPETMLSGNLLKLPDGGFQCRNIPLIIKTTEDVSKNEEGVINFNNRGLIADMYFGLEQHKYKSLMSQGIDLSDFRRRQIILDFLENFRTAYNRKDLDMIGKTFSDNALIIVGRVLENRPDHNEMMLSLGKKKVELIRYNKQQYMIHLSKTFGRNSFIDVRFDDIAIVKHPGFGNIYGVNLRQVWRSTTYRDEGYLFLMIDFENESHPLVHVRAWQPNKETAREDIIELGDFDIIK